MNEAVEKFDKEKFINYMIVGQRYYYYWDGEVIKARLSDILEVLGELGYRRIPELEGLSDEGIDLVTVPTIPNEPMAFMIRRVIKANIQATVDKIRQDIEEANK